MGDVGFCLGELLNIGIIEVHHMDEHSLRAKETDRLAVRHRRMPTRIEKYTVGLDFSAVHSNRDILFARQSGHFLVQIVGDPRM